MKKFDTVVDIAALNAKPNEVKAIAELGYNSLFEEQLIIAIRAKYGMQAGAYGNPQAGLPLVKGRVWYRIQRKLEQHGGTVIEFEEAEWDFLKELLLFEGSVWDPVQYRLIMQYVDKIEAVELQAQRGE